LALVVVAAYWILRPRKKLDEALKESYYEKYRRFIGLYLTIPDDVRIRPENQAAVKEFESLPKQLESWIDQKTFKFTRDDAPDFIHNLHLAFLQIASVPFLLLYIKALENEYRQAVGPMIVVIPFERPDRACTTSSSISAKIPASTESPRDYRAGALPAASDGFPPPDAPIAPEQPLRRVFRQAERSPLPIASERLCRAA
jgi:hypothetical protein